MATMQACSGQRGWAARTHLHPWRDTLLIEAAVLAGRRKVAEYWKGRHRRQRCRRQLLHVACQVQVLQAREALQLLKGRQRNRHLKLQAGKPHQLFQAVYYAGWQLPRCKVQIAQLLKLEQRSCRAGGQLPALQGEGCELGEVRQSPHRCRREARQTAENIKRT